MHLCVLVFEVKEGPKYSTSKVTTIRWSSKLHKTVSGLRLGFRVGVIMVKGLTGMVGFRFWAGKRMMTMPSQRQKYKDICVCACVCVSEEHAPPVKAF